MAQKFKVGDPVWAKMKGFPPWPSVITPPPPELQKRAKATVENSVHSVLFFGTRNYSFVHQKNIKCYYKHKVERSYMSVNTKLFQKACAEMDDFVHFGADLNDWDTFFEEHEERYSARKVYVTSYTHADALGIIMRPDKLVPKIILRRIDNLRPPRVKKKRPKRSQTVYSRRIPKIQWPEPPQQRLRMFNVDNISLRRIVPSKLKFGFIGLGMMGSGILKNLLSSGHRVVIWDQSKEKCADFNKAGAAVAPTPCDVAISAQIVFCCSAETDKLRTTFLGKAGVMFGMNEEKGFVEMSAIDSDTSEYNYIPSALDSVHTRYLKVRFRGNQKDAEEGDLILLSSGDETLYRDCVSCFKSMCRYQAYYNSYGRLSTLSILI